MSGSIADRARGLVDTNEAAEAAGALSIAENVVVEPGGTLAIRPTFSLLESGSAFKSPRTIVDVTGAPGFVGLGLDGITYEMRSEGIDYTGGPIQPPPNDPTNNGDPPLEHPWFNARSFLMLSTDVGWKRARRSYGGPQAFAACGIEWTLALNRLLMMGTIGGVGPEAPPWSGLVAYRLCVRRTVSMDLSYLGNYIQRGVPSVRYTTAQNLIGGQRSALSGGDRYYIRGLQAGDVIEWYRTRDSGSPLVPPDSSHFLCCEYALTSADIANGYFYNTTKTFDTLPDDELGAALYTNPEREGIEKAKYLPPIANAGAFFNRCAWYGDTQSLSRLSMSLRSVGHTIDFTGTTTSGNNTITAVPSTTGLRVGQYVCDSNNTPRSNGTNFPARTYITAISGPGPGATVTVSENATASTAGVGFGACNWIDPSVLARFATSAAALVSGTSTVQVNNATGIFVDMKIWDSTTDSPFTAGTYTKADTWITGITGAGPYTLTLSKTLSASVASMTFRIGDTMLIGGVDEFVAGPTAGVTYGPGGAPYTTATRVFAVSATDTYGTSILWLTQAVNYNAQIANRLIKMVPTGTEGAYGALTTGDFTLESFGLAPTLSGGSTSIRPNVNSEAPLAFWPPTNASTEAFGYNDRRYNRVMWSAPDEPDAVPIPNFVDIGSNSNVIQRLVPLRASMLVFTTEGLYRIAGVPPDAWAVDLIDPTVRLVSRTTVDVIDNVAYAWTTRGVIAVDEASFVDVSTGAIGKRLEAYARDAATSLTHQWLATWKTQHLVLVGCGTDTTLGETTEVFAYNTQSRAWTSWPMTYRRMLESGTVLAACRADRYITATQETTGPASKGYDLLWPIAAWATDTDPTHLLVDDVDYAPWRPRVGDYMRFLLTSGDTEWRRIAAFGADSPGVTRFVLSRAFTSTIDEINGVEVASVDVEWTPGTAGSLQGFHQRWREGLVTVDISGKSANPGDTDDFDSSGYAYQVEPGFGATTDQAPVALNRKLVALPPSSVRTLPLRFAMRRDVARGAVIWPRFKMAAIGWPARVYGVTMQRLGASEKVRR